VNNKNNLYRTNYSSYN